MSNTLQIKRGSATNLPNLSEGEFGYCLDTKQLYIGGSNGNDRVGASLLPQSIMITLSTANWDSTNQTQIVTVSGIIEDEATQFVQIVPTMTSATGFHDADIFITGKATDSLTFAAKTVPTEDLTVYVVIQEMVANATTI